MSGLSAEMVRKIVAEQVALTPEEHLAKATDLLAGRYERDNAPFTPYTYGWEPPTAVDAARAQAHATIAAALMVLEARTAVTVAEPELRPAVPR
jgi:hypothetical protein